MRCRDIVRAEFKRRRQTNPRYSLRRFAQALGVHHATLSRLFRGTRPVPARTVHAVCSALGMREAERLRLIGVEEAATVAAVIARPGFRPGSRAVAMLAGLPVDNVNVALHALLRDGHLRMVSPSAWVVSRGEEA